MNQQEHDALKEMTEDEARAWLKERYGEVWDTKEVQEVFKITSFMAPFCVAERKSDGKTGHLTFVHEPRFYFNFQ